MDAFIRLMSGAGPVVYVIIGLFVLGLIAIGVKLATGDRYASSDLKREIVTTLAKSKKKKAKGVDGILGTGRFNCFCVRPKHRCDLWTIPEPIGEHVPFSPLTGKGGYGYLVEEEDGQLIPMSWREVDCTADDSPRIAWFAMCWDVLKIVMAVPYVWWKSPASWYAVGMMGIVFILGLVVFD